MLNIGIIGAGRMGGNHASHLAKIPGVRLAAVYDIDPARSAAFAEKIASSSPAECIALDRLEPSRWELF